MDIREFFYWTASIALILLGLFIIALFAFLIYLKRLSRSLVLKFESRMDEISNNFGSAARAWKNLALTRFIIRALKLIF